MNELRSASCARSGYEKVRQRRSGIAQRLNVEGDGKVLIRSPVIEASGSSEAWYVPPRPSLTAALLDAHFEHPEWRQTRDQPATNLKATPLMQ